MGHSIKTTAVLAAVIFSLPCAGQTVQWVTSNEFARWITKGTSEMSDSPAAGARLDIYADSLCQEVDGFGACFNEICWDDLSALPGSAVDTIMKSLFDTSGCDFNICRMPVGASDYASSYYSLNDNSGDFFMDNFSIERDRRKLIPYIKAAMKYRPDLKMWGSPWTPPAWMKTNGLYHGGSLTWSSQNLSAYALYLAKAVKAYQAEGLNFFMLAFQNEPYADQTFPSCLWNGTQMRDFVKLYLGPRWKSDSVKAQLYTPTMNNGNFEECIAPMFNDPEASAYVTGACFQWDGENAIANVAKTWPAKRLMQSENPCGDGNNNWAYGEFTFGKFKSYFEKGANSYMIWNMVLDQTGLSSWGWKQCAMITIDTIGKTVTWNPQYHVARHFSHFVKPGARRVKTGGANTNCLAFKNKSGSIISVVENTTAAPQTIALWSKGKSASFSLAAKSFSTFVIEDNTGVSRKSQFQAANGIQFSARYCDGAITITFPGTVARWITITDLSGRIVFRSDRVSSGNRFFLPRPLSPGWFCVTARGGEIIARGGMLVN
jgi:glucosylceramidase